MNRADAGGADFEEQDRSELFGLELGDRALVGPEVGELLGKSDGRDGKQRTWNRVGLGGDACGRKMEAVIIDRAEPR